MPRPHVFSVPTTLYHPIEGARVFPAGETDPGAMWSERPGGEPVGSRANIEALKELIEAQERIEHLEERLMAAGRDLDESAKTREDALGKVQGLEQDLIKAHKDAEEAKDLAVQYMRERDDARKQLSQAGAGQKPAAAKA